MPNCVISDFIIQRSCDENLRSLWEVFISRFHFHCYLTKSEIQSCSNLDFFLLFCMTHLLAKSCGWMSNVHGTPFKDLLRMIFSVTCQLLCLKLFSFEDAAYWMKRNHYHVHEYNSKTTEVQFLQQAHELWQLLVITSYFFLIFSTAVLE